MNSLTPKALKIQNLLNELGYEYKVIEHADSTRTAIEAAERAGCQLGQIVKSLIFRGKSSGKPILILTSGSNRVDEKKIAVLAGEPILRADADFVYDVTGFSIGGVPPIGHAQKLESYLDEDLLQYSTVWAAAGAENAIFELTPGDLKTMTGAIVAAVRKDNS
jgi:prolyl-tRNA editing enzyme YbaK/EbsC (Cys-tRNA(Pro) deacylase)